MARYARTLTQIIPASRNLAQHCGASIGRKENCYDERIWDWHGLWWRHRYVVGPCGCRLGHCGADQVSADLKAAGARCTANFKSDGTNGRAFNLLRVCTIGQPLLSGPVKMLVHRGSLVSQHAAHQQIANNFSI